METANWTMRELLRGCVAGSPQTAGLMQVIPLLSTLQDERFVSPKKARVLTRDYGTLEFVNPTDWILLIPLHAAYVVKAAVQDHAMTHAGLVAAGKRKAFPTAACIQQTQSGLIKEGQYQFMILPYALREAAIQARQVQDYAKLWNAITQFNQRSKLTAKGNLHFFLDAHERELNRFIAQFEPVPEQIGAIVLVAGEVVGVERTPSENYWLATWEALIRECYGSLAIQKGETWDSSQLPDWRVPLADKGVQSLDDLEQALDKATQQEQERARATIRGLLDTPFQQKESDHFQKLTLDTIQNPQFTGQMLHEAEQVLYVSLTTTEQWHQRRAWAMAKEFEI